jgi:hypothetical protein
MLGHKVRDFKPLKAVSLEDLVPEEDFYRQVERGCVGTFGEGRDPVADRGRETGRQGDG